MQTSESEILIFIAGYAQIPTKKILGNAKTSHK
jgi:hypothetical protein